jgi:serine protease AprX
LLVGDYCKLATGFLGDPMTHSTSTTAGKCLRRGTFRMSLVVLLIAALSHPDVNHARGGEPKEKRSKLDRVLQKAAATGDTSQQRVIVRARDGRRSAVAELLKKHGDRIESEHRRLDSFTATVHGDDLLALERDPDVRAVSVDAVITADRVMQEVGQEDQQIENLLVSALGLSDTAYDGDKIGIAVIDSGLEKSDDLSGGRADRFFDFTADGRAAHPYDDYGHGTHVATLIAGRGKNSERDVQVLEDGKLHRTKLALYRGLAPKARIISLKVLDSTGAGYTSSVLRALEFAIENRDKLKIDIVNLSLGHPVYESPETDPLVRAVEDAVRAGLVVVASAGNNGLNQETGLVGYAGITSPGNAPSAITVGAMDTHDTDDRGDDTVAPYSSRGPAWYSGLAKPDLVAPGHRLVAVGAYRGSLYERYSERRVWGRSADKKARYLRLSGTSMAAAVTSGVVALMLEANREAYETPLTPNTVKAILEYTALPLTSADPLTQGAGGLNGGGAVLLAEAIDPGRPIGDSWLSRPSSRGPSSTGNRSAGPKPSSGATRSSGGTLCSRTSWHGDKPSSGARRSFGEPQWFGATPIWSGTTRTSGARLWFGGRVCLALPMAAAFLDRTPWFGGPWINSFSGRTRTRRETRTRRRSCRSLKEKGISS